MIPVIQNPTHGQWVDFSGPAYNESAPNNVILFFSARREEKSNNGTHRRPRCRQDLNHPPTSRGWDFEFLTVSEAR